MNSQIEKLLSGINAKFDTLILPAGHNNIFVTVSHLNTLLAALCCHYVSAFWRTSFTFIVRAE